MSEHDDKYTVGTWAGLTQWRCSQCPWDTLESEKAMIAHWRQSHAPPPPVPTLILDPSGQPAGAVQLEEESDDEE